MNQVYVPPDGVEPVANIVFLHGLFGGPWKTWADDAAPGRKEDRPFWPKKLLPKHIENTRVFSFGYDADVNKFMASAGQNTVFQHGTNLLHDLEALVEQDGQVSIFTSLMP